MRPIISLFIVTLLLVTNINAFTYKLDQPSKSGQKLQALQCNKDTIIDLYFSPSTTVTDCTAANNGVCTLANKQLSTLRFLDRTGFQATYTLSAVEVYKTGNTDLSRAQQLGVFKFTFSGFGKNVIIGVPFSNTLTASIATRKPYQLDLSNLNDAGFSVFKSATVTSITTGTSSLSPFNYLNRIDYGHFYHVADSSTTNTYLLAYFILNNAGIDSTTLFAYPTSAASIPPSGFTNWGTGDKLCYGSQTQGIFQTHLRQSYPLWTAMIGVFFYWIYLLMTEANQINCYDKKFEDNKWTSWGFYSLHFLGHEDYFTKLSRTTQMLITFSWEGCVIAILYSQVPRDQGSVMILWAALVGAVTAMPFNYVMGYVFLRNIYSLTLRKYETLKKMKGVFNKKDGLDGYQKQIDDIEESLYGYYYWYYVLAFCFFTAFWTISVHEMQIIQRQYYYYMYYFLASVAVALGFEHLFFDPILTYIFGNTQFYRARGFYYDFRLGQRFKDIEQ